MASVPPPPVAPHPAPPELPEVPHGVTPRSRRIPPWGPWTALGALFGALLGATVLGSIALAIGGDFDDPPAAASIVSTILQDVCFIAAAWLFATIRGRPQLWQFGIRRPQTGVWRAAGWVVLGYVAFLIFTAIWLAILGKQDTQENLPDELGAGDSTVALLAVAFIVTVCAPIAEEFLFRGYIFTALRNWRGVWPAAILGGLLFGGVHAGSSDVEFLLPLAVLGAALCIIYARTGSLYPCMVLHCLNNCIAFGSSEDWSWQIPVLMVVSLVLIAGAMALALRLRPADAVAPAVA